jgi:hypothetical protein
VGCTANSVAESTLYASAPFGILWKPIQPKARTFPGTVIARQARTFFYLFGKYVQATLTLRKEQCPVVYINNTVIPQSPTAKYLGLHLDFRLRWAQHLAKKRKQT